MKLTVQSNRKGYLYLFLQAPRGNWHCLLPEKEKQELIPAQGKIQLTLPIKAPFGKLKFKALISEQPLKNVKRASILSGMDLKQIELKLEQLKAKQRWSWGSNSLEVTTLDPNK